MPDSNSYSIQTQKADLQVPDCYCFVFNTSLNASTWFMWVIKGYEIEQLFFGPGEVVKLVVGLSIVSEYETFWWVFIS